MTSRPLTEKSSKSSKDPARSLRSSDARWRPEESAELATDHCNPKIGPTDHSKTAHRNRFDRARPAKSIWFGCWLTGSSMVGIAVLCSFFARTRRAQDQSLETLQ